MTPPEARGATTSISMPRPLRSFPSHRLQVRTMGRSRVGSTNDQYAGVPPSVPKPAAEGHQARREQLQRATVHATMRGTMVRSLLELRNLGPIESADVTFGDLTVFTGPQASGKSIALQMLKLALDQAAIVRRMSDQGLAWRDGRTFIELYLGTGMRSLWSSATTARWERRSLKPPNAPTSRASDVDERVSYIPA